MIILFMALLLTITDGDTVRLGEERIRLLGIDAPELHRAKCPRERKIAKEARQRLKALLGEGSVVIHRQSCPVGTKRCPCGHIVDVFGRTLARITVDGRDVGEVLMKEGLADEYRPHNDHWRWCR